MRYNQVILSCLVNRPVRIFSEKSSSPVGMINVRCHSPKTGKFSDFHDMVCFASVARKAHAQLQPGMWITVFGELDHGRYRKGGKQLTRTQIVVRDFTFGVQREARLRDVVQMLARPDVELDDTPDEELGI